MRPWYRRVRFWSQLPITTPERTPYGESALVMPSVIPRFRVSAVRMCMRLESPEVKQRNDGKIKDSGLVRDGEKWRDRDSGIDQVVSLQIKREDKEKKVE